MTSYGAPEWHCLDAIAAIFPRAEVVNPAKCFANNADWLVQWLVLVPTLSAVVVFGDVDGNLGAERLREVTDAVAAALPVLRRRPPARAERASPPTLPVTLRTRRGARRRRGLH